MTTTLSPRATTKTKDITGGLPRVVALLEARHPRDKAVITEVAGTVHYGPVVKGMRRIIIETDEGTRHEYSVPRSVHVNVQEGERVRAGDPLSATRRREKGPLDLRTRAIPDATAPSSATPAPEDKTAGVGRSRARPSARVGKSTRKDSP